MINSKSNDFSDPTMLFALLAGGNMLTHTQR